SEPGHVSNEIPPKAVLGFKAGQGVVDFLEPGSPPNMSPPMEAGALRIPDWGALEQEWPLIADLRKLTPPIPGGPNRTTLQDYCMLGQQSVWGAVYNKNTVRPEEIENLKWDDLLTDRWRGRVVLDPAASGGLRLFPFQKDWPMERSTAWAQNVAA